MSARQEIYVDQERKKLLIHALKKGHIDSASYSLDGYKEEAVCIERNHSNWIVYDGERGYQHNIEKYKDFEVAGYRLINRVSDSDESEAVMMVDYLANVLARVTSSKTLSKKQNEEKTLK